MPGTYKTLGVRPEIPALKRQRQEDLKIKAILNLKQFKASLECPRFSLKKGASPPGLCSNPKEFYQSLERPKIEFMLGFHQQWSLK